MVDRQSLKSCAERLCRPESAPLHNRGFVCRKDVQDENGVAATAYSVAAHRPNLCRTVVQPQTLLSAHVPLPLTEGYFVQKGDPKKSHLFAGHGGGHSAANPICSVWFTSPMGAPAQKRAMRRQSGQIISASPSPRFFDPPCLCPLPGAGRDAVAACSPPAQQPRRCPAQRRGPFQQPIPRRKTRQGALSHRSVDHWPGSPHVPVVATGDHHVCH